MNGYMEDILKMLTERERVRRLLRLCLRLGLCSSGLCSGRLRCCRSFCCRFCNRCGLGLYRSSRCCCRSG